MKLVACALILLATACAAGVPRPAPEFAVRMPDGSDIRISEQRGKVVCLLFILTTCPHCQKLVATMSKLQPELAPRGLFTIAASVQDVPSLYVPDFVRDFKPAFPVGWADRKLAMEFMHHDPQYIFYSPCMSLIDRQGMIRAQFAGGDEIFNGDQEAHLRAKIEPLLKPQGQKKGASHKPAPKRR